MPDLLLELLSEEIPARMQAQASADLKRLVTDALVERGLVYEGAESFATPRRLCLLIGGLPARQPDTREERKGPRVGAPPGAIQGFVKATGLASIAAATITHDAKKGDFYTAVIARAGQDTAEVVAAFLPGLLKSFPWPKSMRWGAASTQAEAFRWVRPLQSVVCTFGAETEEPDVVPFTVAGLVSGDTTRGHRFMAPEPFRVKRFDDYVTGLARAKVVLDPARRRDIIRHDARDLALAQGLEVVEDEALLNEVAGLVEWPVVLLGRFDAAFLAIPPEVIRATIRANQKCFVTRWPEGNLADRFVLVSNIVAPDGGGAIVAGNERVVRARLSDARFFWESDCAVPLDSRLAKLDAIVFHEELGTQGQRVARIVALACRLAPSVHAESALVDRAARLAKADLVSDMVGEFPELQGLMGRYYATRQGEHTEVAAAIEDHYRPQGPSDRVPAAPVSVAVALADKLDTLIGFWAIDEKPTGSKDPYGLRRAGLGVIRIVLEHGLRLRLLSVLTLHGLQIESRHFAEEDRSIAEARDVIARTLADRALDATLEIAAAFGPERDARWVDAAVVAHRLAVDLLIFLAERLKIHLREQGARHDLIDAVFALPGQDDLVLIVRRVEALGRFLDSEDGKSLLAGQRRAANILRAEEKKDGAGAFADPFDPAGLILPDERALAAALVQARAQAAACVAAEDFEAAMRVLARLRAPVDAFFDRVTVNAEDAALRLNRLRLLDALRRTMLTLADFSKVGG